jgi:hypothetical protein
MVAKKDCKQDVGEAKSESLFYLNYIHGLRNSLMRLCFYREKMQEMKSSFGRTAKRHFLVKKHAALAGTRLGRTRRSRRGGVDDGCRQGLSLGRDDDGDVNVACLRHLLACNGDGASGDGRGSGSDCRLLGCRDGLGGGRTDFRDGGGEGVVVGHGLGAVVGCSLVERRLPLEVCCSLGDEGLLEIFAGAAAGCEFALEVEGCVEPALAEGVEDAADDAADETLLAVDDVFHDVLEVVAEHGGDDACDRVLDVAGWFDGAGSWDCGCAGNDIPSLSTLGYGDESSRVGDGGRLRCDRLCTSA